MQLAKNDKITKGTGGGIFDKTDINLFCEMKRLHSGVSALAWIIIFKIIGPTTGHFFPTSFFAELLVVLKLNRLSHLSKRSTKTYQNYLMGYKDVT